MSGSDKYVRVINEDGRNGISHHEIARKIYLSFPTYAFIDREEIGYSISNQISKFFDVPISTIQFVGSAKLGRSFHKKKDFVLGSSDLDVAIIDTRLFAKYMDFVMSETGRYSDLRRFSKTKRRDFNTYIAYLSKGVFRPDLMISGVERSRIADFFSKLSSSHLDYFSSISASIYMSQCSFEFKQKSAVSNILNIGEL